MFVEDLGLDVGIVMTRREDIIDSCAVFMVTSSGFTSIASLIDIFV